MLFISVIFVCLQGVFVYVGVDVAPRCSRLNERRINATETHLACASFIYNSPLTPELYFGWQ